MKDDFFCHKCNCNALMKQTKRQNKLYQNTSLLLIEKPVMREKELRKLRHKIQNSYQVMEVSKFN